MEEVDSGKYWLVSSETLNELITSVNEWRSLILVETTNAGVQDKSTLTKAEGKSILRIAHPACL